MASGAPPSPPPREEEAGVLSYLTAASARERNICSTLMSFFALASKKGRPFASAKAWHKQTAREEREREREMSWCEYKGAFVLA
jgi:hypothetical protein